jgi:hypothetical protein
MDERLCNAASSGDVRIDVDRGLSPFAPSHFKQRKSWACVVGVTRKEG